MNSVNKRKVVFLDRDTMITGKFINERMKMLYFKEDAFEVMQILIQNGYAIITLSETKNSMIDVGNKNLVTFPKDFYLDFASNFLAQCHERDIMILEDFSCSGSETDQYKSKKDMLSAAIEKYEIDTSASYFCGNNESDEQAAVFYQIPFYGLNYSPKYIGKKITKLSEICEDLGFIKKTGLVESHGEIYFPEESFSSMDYTFFVIEKNGEITIEQNHLQETITYQLINQTFSRIDNLPLSLEEQQRLWNVYRKYLTKKPIPESNETDKGIGFSGRVIK